MTELPETEWIDPPILARKPDALPEEFPRGAEIPEDLDPLADGVLMVHQAQWLEDESDLKVCAKGRRTGITFAEALDDTLIAAAKRSAGGQNVFYIGDTKDIPAILLSVGLDRRAAPDDPLPDSRSQFLTPSSFSERRGAVADGLNQFGEQTGSKLWLLNRAKHTETTRLMCEFWLAEALAWAEPETGTPAEIEVGWLRRGVLGYRVMVADSSVSLSRTVEG